jgi:hypothetical protein
VVEEDPGLKETYTGSRCTWVLTDCRVPGQVCLVFRCDVVQMTRESQDLVQ